jgi:hypothetical protein
MDEVRFVRSAIAVACRLKGGDYKIIDSVGHTQIDGNRLIERVKGA